LLRFYGGGSRGEGAALLPAPPFLARIELRKLTINGEQREFPDGLTVASLVAQISMKQDRVAVELNRNIVPRDQWAGTNLAEGDQLEIVHFVGGGRVS
jgi:thiamine biosynthesis protein ThiS